MAAMAREAAEQAQNMDSNANMAAISFRLCGMWKPDARKAKSSGVDDENSPVIVRESDPLIAQKPDGTEDDVSDFQALWDLIKKSGIKI